MLSEPKIRNRALWYIGKYAPSEKKLRQYIKNFIQKSHFEQNLALDFNEYHEIIEKLLADCQKNQLINDEKLSLAYTNQYQRMGLSFRKIQEKMQLKGFALPNCTEYNPEEEYNNALKFGKKHKIWRFDDKKFYNKMQSGGFNYEIAQKIWRIRHDLANEGAEF